MTERGEDWASELWPEEDDYWPEYRADQLRTGTAAPHALLPGRRALLGLMTTAAVALAAGVGGALAVKDLTARSSPPPSTGGGQPGGGEPAGGQPGGGVASIVVGGDVTAVTPRSITIGAGPQSVTARVTSATRFSGRVTRIAGVRVGNEVLAEISERNGVNSLVTLQDPASLS